MIKNRKPLSMAESLDYVEEKKENDSDTDIRKFIKKFVEIKPEEAVKIREKLNALGLIKLRHESIAKIIDVMPEDSESLNKIFTDVSIDEDETKKILDVLKEFK